MPAEEVIFVRVPSELKQRLQRDARAQGMSLTGYLLRVLGDESERSDEYVQALVGAAVAAEMEGFREEVGAMVQAALQEERLTTVEAE